MNDTATDSANVYIAARMRATDAALTCGAELVFEEDVLGFKVIVVERRHLPCVLSALLDEGSLLSPLTVAATLEDIVTLASKRCVMLRQGWN